MSGAPSGVLRVGLAGYGYAGRVFHAPLLRTTPGVVLTAVASGDAAKVRADLPDQPVVPDVAALVARDDVDAVVIATPNATHAPLAERALAAGKHVVVDKPFALDLEEARRMAAAARAAARVLAVFHNRRWDSDVLAIRAAIRSGVIGEVRHFESRIDRFRPEVRRRWREMAGPGAGLWFDLGPHLLDQALWLFGLPARVRLSLATLRAGAETDDWAQAVLEYDRRRVVLGCSLLAAGATMRFVVHGETGSLSKHGPDLQEDALKAGLLPGGPGWGEDPDRVLLHRPGNGPDAAPVPLPAVAGDQRQFYAAFARHVHGLPGPLPTVDEALAVMAALDAGARSAAGGRAEALALTPAERAAFEARNVLQRQA